MTENEKYIYDHFLISIKSGFESLEDIIEGALEAVEEEGWQREVSEEWVTETLTREYEKNLSDSKTWSKETDTEKLRLVFDKLRKNKIVTAHSIGYDTSEAIYDIQEIWQELEDHDIHPIGYCYYHGQDLERVIETGDLCIGFSGVKEKNEKEAIGIGNKVVDALKEAGFTVEWNNSASERIIVTNFNWQNVFISEEDVDKKWSPDLNYELMKA